MSFCGYCGSKMPDEMKFCTKCGKPLTGVNTLDSKVTENQDSNSINTGNSEALNNIGSTNPNPSISNSRSSSDNSGGPGISRNPNINYGTVNNGNPNNYLGPNISYEELERIRKFERKEASKRSFYEGSWTIAVLLMILAVVDYYSDPPFITILLSAGIIAATVLIFVFHLKGKIVSVLAAILAAYCLFCGFEQAAKFGIFVIPTHQDYVDAGYSQSSSRVSDDSSSSQSSSSHSSSASSTSSSSSGSSTSGKVDPNLKAFLDGYESFMNDYVDFMKKYTSGSADTMSMMNDYLTMVQKYTDYCSKLESYDTNSMSDADLAYYLEVTERVERKLLSLY